MKLKIAAVAILSLLPAPAWAASDLWRTLKQGMTVDEAAQALRAMPEIKSVDLPRAKAGEPTKLKIKYQANGVDLFGVPFKLALEFESGALKNVILGAMDQCLVEGGAVIEKTMGVLHEKYPTHLHGPKGYDEALASRAILDALSTKQKQTVTSAMTNGSTAVVFIQAYKYTAHPDYVYGAGNLGRLGNELMRSAYKSQQEACGGTGLKRVDVGIMYMAQEALDAQLATAERAEDGAREQAKKGL